MAVLNAMLFVLMACALVGLIAVVTSGCIWTTLKIVYEIRDAWRDWKRGY